MDEEKDDGGDETGEKRLRKKEGEKQKIEVPHRIRIENIEKDKEQDPFTQAKDEDEKELGCETVQVKPLFEKLCHIKNNRSG